MTTISDLHFLTMNSRPEREQIRAILTEMGTPSEVVDWFFTTLAQQRRDYSALQHQLRVAEARLPEE